MKSLGLELPQSVDVAWPVELVDVTLELVDVAWPVPLQHNEAALL